MAAPATAIIGYDLDFAETLPKLFPRRPSLKDDLAGKPEAAPMHGVAQRQPAGRLFHRRGAGAGAGLRTHVGLRQCRRGQGILRRHQDQIQFPLQSRLWRSGRRLSRAARASTSTKRARSCEDAGGRYRAGRLFGCACWTAKKFWPITLKKWRAAMPRRWRRWSKRRWRCRHRFCRTGPPGRHHRARHLHRPAGRPGLHARFAGGAAQAADWRDHAGSDGRRNRKARSAAAIHDAKRDEAYLLLWENGETVLAPAVMPFAEAVEKIRGFGPCALAGTGAPAAHQALGADFTLTRYPPARCPVGGAAGASAARRPMRRPRRFICARPTPSFPAAKPGMTPRCSTSRKDDVAASGGAACQRLRRSLDSRRDLPICSPPRALSPFICRTVLCWRGLRAAKRKFSPWRWRPGARAGSGPRFAAGRLPSCRAALGAESHVPGSRHRQSRRAGALCRARLCAGRASAKPIIRRGMPAGRRRPDPQAAASAGQGISPNLAGHTRQWRRA